MRQAWLLVVLAVTAFPVRAMDWADVPMCGPAYGALEWMGVTGVLTGYPDGTFHGAGPVTHRELEVTLGRLMATAAGWQVPGARTVLQDRDLRKRLHGDLAFGDIPYCHWAYQAVHELAREGVIEGYPSPAWLAQPVTQGEALAVMDRVAVLLDLHRAKWDPGQAPAARLADLLRAEPNDPIYGTVGPAQRLNRYGLAVLLSDLLGAVSERWQPAAK